MSAVLSVSFPTILSFGMADGGAGWRLRTALYFYLFAQLLIAIFFLFDILRIEAWRRGLRTRYPDVVVIMAAAGFDLFLWVALLNSRLLTPTSDECHWPTLLIGLLLMAGLALLFVLSALSCTMGILQLPTRWLWNFCRRQYFAVRSALTFDDRPYDRQGGV